MTKQRKVKVVVNGDKVQIVLGEVVQGGNHKRLELTTIEAVIVVQKIQEELGIQ